MALSEIQQKRQIIESRSRIREFVFGIQDGLISTVGLLSGVQGATENSLVVIVTGLTAMFSGAISMAAGSYLSAGAQKDIFEKEITEAEKMAEREPYIAAEGLLRALGEEGLNKELSYRMVKTLLQERNVFLRTFREKVFRLGQRGHQPTVAGSPGHGTFIHCGRGRADLAVSLFDRRACALSFRSVQRHDSLRGRRLQRMSRGPIAWSFGFAILRVAVSAAGLGYLIGLVVQHFFPGVSIPA